MSVFKGILNEEFERLKRLADLYRKELHSLPKGSLSTKKIRGRPYCYRAYRDKQKVKFVYLGKPDSPGVKEARENLERRKELMVRLKQVSADIKELARAIDGSR